jgi:hypothetical protein
VSRHSGPHFTLPPDDQRCDAVVRGIPSYNWKWQRVDHRCPRRASQTRGVPGSLDIMAVCHAHARSRTVQHYQHKGRTRVAIVSEDKFRDAVKFLMGLGTGPSLTPREVRTLNQALRGPFANGMSAEDASSWLVKTLGWEKQKPGDKTAQPEGKKQVGTVSMEPTWVEYLPLLLEAYSDPNSEKREEARAALEHMAQSADGYIEMQRKVTESMSAMNKSITALREKLTGRPIPRSQESDDGKK